MTIENAKKAGELSRKLKVARHFIEKADSERDEYYAAMAESMVQEGEE